MSEPPPPLRAPSRPPAVESAALERWRVGGRRVQVSGRHLFVRECGEGPVLLLVHGYPTCSLDYDGMVGDLSRDHRCITVDLLGCGLSDKPAATSYSLFDQADLVEGLLAALGVKEAHVVAHDMGTSVVTELLARRLERRLGFEVLSATFLNGSMIQWLATITPFQELLASNTTLRRGMEICESFAGFYIPALQGLMQRPEVLQGEPGELLLELLLTGDGHLRVAAMGGYMRERYLHEGRWIPALTALGARAQLVWATDDPIANVALGRELSRRCPEARYVELPGLGHFLLMEDPARVAAEVRAFVGGLAR